MKILSIAGILPIPGAIPDNDFVYQIYSVKEVFKDDTVVIIKPTQYKTNMKKIITHDTDFDRLKRKMTWEINNFIVEILPFFSCRKARNLHSLVCHSIYYLNKKRIHWLINEYDFDIIHAQYIYPDGLLANILSKKFKIPYVITSHLELYYFNHFLSRQIGLKILRQAKNILSINYTNHAYFESAGLKNSEILPLGFSKSFIRKQKKPSKDTIRIVTVSQLIKRKNINRTIKAFARLLPKYDVSFTIIGRGSKKKELKNLVNNLNLEKYIEFIDFVPHEKIADELYKYDIFALPSWDETFGRVYFEAMAMGIPVICANKTGIYGIFKKSEEAVYVDYRSVDDIYNALEFLVANEKDRLKIGMNGKRLVEKYTWNDVAATIRSRYNAILQSKQY